MKKYLLYFILFLAFKSDAQIIDSVRYAVYFDRFGVQHTSAVATKMSSITGSYFDLVTKPTTVAQFGVADMVSTSALTTALAPYTPTASYSTVATTGSYNDLLNKPTIPTQSISSVFGRTGVISASTGDYTTSQVTEGTNLYYTTARITTALTPYNTATQANALYVSLTGNYTNPTWITSLPYSKITGTPTLATVATTGMYSDLTGKPVNVSAFTNDANYVTLTAARAGISTTGSLSYSPTTGVISYTQPTIVSTFTNDAGYIPNAIALTDIANANINQVSTTTNYTITAANFATGKKPELFISCDATGGNITTTLPSATTYNGFIIHVGKVDATANAVTIAGLSKDNIITIQGSVKDIASINNTWTQQ